jgi:hypothetical protein
MTVQEIFERCFAAIFIIDIPTIILCYQHKNMYKEAIGTLEEYLLDTETTLQIEQIEMDKVIVRLISKGVPEVLTSSVLKQTNIENFIKCVDRIDRINLYTTSAIFSGSGIFPKNEWLQQQSHINKVVLFGYEVI